MLTSGYTKARKVTVTFYHVNGEIHAEINFVITTQFTARCVSDVTRIATKWTHRA